MLKMAMDFNRKRGKFKKLDNVGSKEVSHC